MTEDGQLQCTRCGREDATALPAPPLPGDVGQRILREICASCWEEWKKQQMLLINHYGIDLRDRRARDFLLENMRAFLFEDGEGGDEIDTSREGSISW